MRLGKFGLLDFWYFYIRPLPGRRRRPPQFCERRFTNRAIPLMFNTHKASMMDKKSPTKTLNKRSLWESLFRPRLRPSKCATPYFNAPNFFNYWCKLTPNWPLKCTPADAHAVACCTGPTTPANPRRAPKRFTTRSSRDGAFAATCAANVQRRCQ